MLRIGLFLATNLAIIAVLSIVMTIFGIQGVLDEQGIGLNLKALLVMAVVIGMTGSFISLALSKWMARRATGAQVIQRPANATEAWLVDTVARQARESGIGMPDVAIYDASHLNAFATGMNRNKAMVAVSTGLLASMNRDEAEAVLGHEVSRLANGDMVTLALIQGVVNTFVVFFSYVIGHVVDRIVFKTERGHGPGYWITTIVAQIVLGILASTIVLWFSRHREFRADAGGARLVGRDKMIKALERLRSAMGQPPLPDQMAAFGISGQFRQGLARPFSTHPPLDARIEALRCAPY
jgi:heat shock protein HtpX